MGKVFQGWGNCPGWIAALLLVGHFSLLICFFNPAFSTPDAHGYFKQAQLIADHGRTWFQEESPIQYFGFHWMAAEGDRLFSRYPPGLPILIALPFKMLGHHAGAFVNYVLTPLTLLGLFLLGRIWVGRRWALVALALMAYNPIVNIHAVTGDSHAATAFFMIWGLVFLARWSQSMSLWAAFLGGLLLGAIPTIRYPEALFGLGIAFFIVSHLKNDKKVWLSAAMAVIGACIPIVCLMMHNQMAFGAVWKTAYSLTEEQTGFSLNYFSENWRLYLKNQFVHGVGILGVLGVAGMGWLCINRNTRRQGVLFILLVLPITLLYMFYFFMLDDHPYSTLRFLMPSFYIYAIACVWGLKFIAERWKTTATAVAAMLLVVNTLWGAPRFLVSMIVIKDADAALAVVEKAVSEHVKPGAVVIAPSHIQQHLDCFDRWRLVEDMALEGLPVTLRYIIGPRYAGLEEKNQGFRSSPMFAGGNKEEKLLRIASQDIKRKIKMRPYMATADGKAPDALLDELDRWSSHGRAIYWIGKVKNMREKVPPNDRLTVKKRIEPPQFRASKIKTMFPDHFERIKDQHWKGLLRRDQFITNPLGISWLIHHDGGLELVKWTRHPDS